ncbi:PAS domain S-box protein [Paludisphaera soli]|uniref:PAS domain S-box protein n=1 Tax=Paludisphaera soli TaxID=2712865 RepID=UPI0013EC23EB|nr:HD domain-containing phosphohydrolase [Paludisphaera soli]
MASGGGDSSRRDASAHPRGLPAREPLGFAGPGRGRRPAPEVRQVFYEWDVLADTILDFGPNCEEVLGYRPAELLGPLDIWAGHIHPDDRDRFLSDLDPIRVSRDPFQLQYRFLHKSGRYITLRDTGQLLGDGSGPPTRGVGFVSDVTEQVQAEELLIERESILQGFFNSAPMGMYILELLDDDLRMLSVNPSGVAHFGIPEEAIRGRLLSELGYDRQTIDLWIGRYRASLRDGRPARYEYADESPSGPVWFSGTLAPIPGPPAARPRFCFIAEDVTGRKRAERELEALNRDSQAIMDTIPDVLYVLDRDGRVVRWNRSLERAIGWTAEEVRGRPALDFFPTDQHASVASAIRMDDSDSGRRIIEACAWNHDGTTTPYQFVSASLRDDEGRVVGLAGIGRNMTERNALEAALRAQAEAVETINRVGRSLSAELDLETLVRSISDASVLLSGASCGAFVPVGLGDHHPSLVADSAPPPFGHPCPSLRRCAELLGPTMRNSETVRLDDLAADERFRTLAEPLSAADPQGLVSLLAVPVKARSGEVLGGLILGHERRGAFDERAELLVSGLAAQAAVALDNARLVEDLQRSRAEIEAAYDETIAGWARALDLRDQETEGHSRRVADLTVRLAEAMGMSDDELVHVRRGALLHDIGKMGIPDGVLLKPGPLDDAEWEVMRRHPTYAYEMLRPIAFLAPALDIPYGHHERWDGTGYPRGLRKRQIPLAARIFAAVDIYDALIYDRPYRKAWRPERAIAYIRSLAGTHLDPGVVSTFLRLMREPEPRRAAGRRQIRVHRDSFLRTWRFARSSHVEA